jgi:hypothetical protein
MKLLNIFKNNASRAAATAMALLFSGTPSMAQTPPPQTGWTTLTQAEDFAEPVKIARDLLTQVDSSFEVFFADTIPVFKNVDPAQTGNVTAASFRFSNNARIVSIYKDRTTAEKSYAAYLHAKKTKSHRLKKNDVLALELAVALSNEATHYWQSKSNEDLLHKLSSEGIACNDTLALEESSDVFMVMTAVKMHRHFTRVGSDEAVEKKHVLERIMSAIFFYNFGAYAQDPSGAQSQKKLEKFLTTRRNTYANLHNCDSDDKTPVSAQARKALESPPINIRISP